MGKCGIFIYVNFHILSHYNTYFKKVQMALASSFLKKHS